MMKVNKKELASMIKDVLKKLKSKDEISKEDAEDIEIFEWKLKELEQA